MKKYVCKRDGVCAGVLLIKWDDVKMGTKLEKNLISDRFIHFKYKNGRVLLFNNDLGYANDLIYDTPVNYPILGLKLNDIIDDDFIIYKHVDLSDILKYLGYGEKLTQYDLDMILNKIFKSRRWLRRNGNLFGNVDNEEYFSKDLYDDLECMSGLSCKPHMEEPYYTLIKKK